MTYRVSLGKNAGKLVGIFKVNRQMWFRCGLFLFFYIVAADTRRAHLLSVPLTTQTDIAPVKYNLELTGEWLLSFHSISPSWLRSKGSTHQYPPQPLPACFIIQCSDVFERNIALHGLFQQLNPVNEPNSYTHTRSHTCLLNISLWTIYRPHKDKPKSRWKALKG